MGRWLKIRIAQHERDCWIGNSNSSLSEHLWKYDHSYDFDFDNIKIVAREKKTIIREEF